MGETDKSAKMSWILHFMQAKWGDLTEEEKHIMKIRLSFFHRSVFFEPTEEQALAPGPGIFTDEDIIKIQSRLRDFFTELLETTKPSSSRRPYVNLPQIKRSLTVSDDGRFQIRRFHSLDLPTPIISQGAISDGEGIMDYIADLILDLPKDSIRRCKECQRLFFHLSKKQKIYCSSSCSWKSLSRERREAIKKHPKQYQAYLKKQKEAMKKYYEKKRKSKPGSKVRTERKEG